MSAPRPYGTDPFHPLGSISNMKQLLYIYNSVQVISSIWYVQVLEYDNCACALTENSNYDPEPFLKSVFHKVHAVVLLFSICRALLRILRDKMANLAG